MVPTQTSPQMSHWALTLTKHWGWGTPASPGALVFPDSWTWQAPIAVRFDVTSAALAICSVFVTEKGRTRRRQ